MSSRRRMPSHTAIFLHWKDWLYQHGKAEPGCVNCFACGMWPVGSMPDKWAEARGVLIRAHIVPRSQGGQDAIDNLHLLCKACHLESELISDRGSYLVWAIRRSVGDAGPAILTRARA